MEDLTPLNKERLEQVSKHKAVKNTWTEQRKIFTLLNDKSVVKIDKEDLSKLPHAFSNPPPCNS